MFGTAAALALQTTPVRAACDSNTPADGATVECTAPDDNTGVAGGDNITVNVRDGAVIAPPGLQVSGIDLRDNATILVEDGATIDGDGNVTPTISVRSGADIDIHGLLQGDRGIGHVTGTFPLVEGGFANSTILLGETGQILIGGSPGYGLDGRGGGNSYQIDGLIETSGNGAHGIRVGDGDNVTVGPTGTIRTTLDDTGSSDGINSLTAGSNVQVTIDGGGLVETLGSLSRGVGLLDGAIVTVNGTIRTAQGVPDGQFDSGANGVQVLEGSTVTVGENGVIVTGVQDEARGQAAHGIQTFGATGGNTNVQMHGSLTTHGNSANGIFTGLGTFLGSVGGDSTVNVTGEVLTTGDFANGIRGLLSDSITIGDGAWIKTSGLLSHGIFLYDVGTSPVSPSEIIVSGTVEATGTVSSGILLWADNGSYSDVTVTESGRVFAQNAAAIADDPFPPVGVSTTLTVAGEVARPSAADTAIQFGGADNTLILLPTYSITGTIAGGAGSDLFRLDGDLGTDGLFDFDINAVAAFETYEKEGAGTWIVQGDGSGLAGDWAVGMGMLFANADLPGVDFNVADGAFLGGIGTLGATTIAGGGTLAPGSSIGTLTATGNVTFNAGSFFDVEVDPGGGADLFAVGGDAVLNGGTVRAFAMPGIYPDEAVYTIMTAGMLTGAFDGVTTDLAFFDPSLVHDYDSDEVLLVLTRNLVVFDEVAEIPNQIATAAAIKDLGAGNPGFDAILPLSEREARAAFDKLSGEVHATALGGVFDSPWFRESILSRLTGIGTDRRPATTLANGMADPLAYRGADDHGAVPPAFGTLERADGWTWWTVRPDAYAAFAEREADGNAASADIVSAGVMVGADRRDGALTLGFAGGLQFDEIEVAARSSEAHVVTAQIGAYGAWTADAWQLRGGATAAFHDFDTERRITVPGLASTATADYSAISGQLFGEVGRRFAPAPDVTVEPYAGLRLAAVGRESFSESGAGAANLSADDEQLSVALLILGLSVVLDLPAAGASVSAKVAWEHAFDDVTPSADLAFPAGTETFHILGPSRSDETLRLAVEAELAVSPSAALFVGIQGAISEHAFDAAVRAGGIVRF